MGLERVAVKRGPGLRPAPAHAPTSVSWRSYARKCCIGKGHQVINRVACCNALARCTQGEGASVPTCNGLLPSPPNPGQKAKNANGARLIAYLAHAAERLLWPALWRAAGQPTCPLSHIHDSGEHDPPPSPSTSQKPLNTLGRAQRRTPRLCSAQPKHATRCSPGLQAAMHCTTSPEP